MSRPTAPPDHRSDGALRDRSGGAGPAWRYAAAVMGDGSVTPITGRLGRRLIRQIDPLSAEGRGLLAAGRVTLWFEDGARAEAKPIGEVLDSLRSTTKRLRDAHPRIAGWTSHHDRILRSIGSMRKVLGIRT